MAARRINFASLATKMMGGSTVSLSSRDFRSPPWNHFPEFRTWTFPVRDFSGMPRSSEVGERGDHPAAEWQKLWPCD